MQFSYKHLGYRINMEHKAIQLIDKRTDQSTHLYYLDKITPEQVGDWRKWARKSPNGGGREQMWLALCAAVDECKERGLIEMGEPIPEPPEPKRFTAKDLCGAAEDHIYCMRNELIYNPPKWMRDGRQETRSGYGMRLNSGYSIHFNGRVYRLYVTCFSNAGTVWFKKGNRKIVVNAN